MTDLDEDEERRPDHVVAPQVSRAAAEPAAPAAPAARPPAIVPDETLADPDLGAHDDHAADTETKVAEPEGEAAEPEPAATPPAAEPGHEATAADTEGDDTEGEADTEGEGGDEAGERRLFRAVLALTLLPLAVAAVVLFVSVRPGYLPTADHALIELQVRDVGHHEVLNGLYSREDWSHPGPMFFYLAAPVYRLFGSTPVAINLVALIVNGVAVAGMAFVARRLGGRGPMLATLVASALLMRTLGAEFVRDPWNVYVTVLPFGLMIFLTWAMLCRETWALPAGVVVTTYLAQTHVGFVLLATPLLLVGTIGLVVSAIRAGPGPDRPRLLRPGLLAVGLLALLWAPVVYDARVNWREDNLGNLLRYFREAKAGVHSLADGWGVVAGQFALPPEWATNSLGQAFTGEDKHMYTHPLPLLLAVLVLAAVVLWRAAPAGRRLVVTLVVALSLGILAVARTIGPAFYYRLRWVWIPPAVAFVVVGWAAWILVDRRWPERGARRMTAAAVVALVALATVNAVTAVTTQTTAEADGDVVTRLLPPLLDDLAGRHGTVVIADAFGTGSWYSRGIVLELERRGMDVEVPPVEIEPYSPHRVYRGGPLAGVYVVTRDGYIPHLMDDPNMRLVAQWSSVTQAELEKAARNAEELDAELDAGLIDSETYFNESPGGHLYDNDRATYYAVAIFEVLEPDLSVPEP